MKLSQFKFKLPEEKIAKYPAPHRDECRMMVLHRKTGEIEHHMFKEILNMFDEHDVFVFNDTKVFPARLYGNKEKTGARIEVFLLRELNQELRLWDVRGGPDSPLYRQGVRAGGPGTLPMHLCPPRRRCDRPDGRAALLAGTDETHGD